MSPSDSNPYAPPAEISSPPPLQNASLLYFRDGDFLVVRDGAELPNACLTTNEPGGEGTWRKKVAIAWTPPWVFITVVLGVLIVLVLMLILQKKAKITYSLGTAARAKILKRRSIGFVLLLAGLGTMIAGFVYSSSWDPAGFLILGGVLLMIVSLVFFVVANPVKVVKFRDGMFRIKGCSQEFLATLPVQMSPF